MNSTAFGSDSLATNTNSYAFGSQSVSTGVNSTAFGANSQATGFNASAFGSAAVANGTNATARGSLARAFGANADAKGAGAQAYKTNAMAYGSGTVASGWQATAFGTGSTAFDTSSLAVGPYAYAAGPFTSAFGAGASATHFGSTAIGTGAVTDRPYQVSVGTVLSPYKLPGLGYAGFAGQKYQNNGEKRIVTTDSEGALGTSSYSLSRLENSIGAAGALSGALSSMPTETLVPTESFRCGVGGSSYAGQYAGAVGCVARLYEGTFFNGGVAGTQTRAINNGDVMGRVGVSFGFGGSSLSEMPSGDVLMAKSVVSGSSPDLLMDKKADATEVAQLRLKLADLKNRITALKSQSTNLTLLQTDHSAERETFTAKLESLISEKKKLKSALIDRLNADSDLLRSDYQDNNNKLALQSKQFEEQQAQLKLLIAEINLLKSK